MHVALIIHDLNLHMGPQFAEISGPAHARAPAHLQFCLSANTPYTGPPLTGKCKIQSPQAPASLNNSLARWEGPGAGQQQAEGGRSIPWAEQAKPLVAELLRMAGLL